MRARGPDSFMHTSTEPHGALHARRYMSGRNKKGRASFHLSNESSVVYQDAWSSYIMSAIITNTTLLSDDVQLRKGMYEASTPNPQSHPSTRHLRAVGKQPWHR